MARPTLKPPRSPLPERDAPLPRQAVVATGNRGKLRELQAALAPLGWCLQAQSAFGVSAGPETATTFVENALAKARRAATLTGLPAIADDSGLVVPALGGAPGVYSARYAGEQATDAENNAKLLRALNRAKDRSAFFYCALVAVATSADATPVVALARWDGEIVTRPRGDNGFGYDPHFLVSTLHKTAAELSPERKNALSHRGQACRMLTAQLATWP